MSSLKTSDKIQWIDDPTDESPTHIMYFDGKEWQLSFPGNRLIAFGENPSTKEVLKHLTSEKTKPKFFLHLPPPPELVSNFKLYFSEADNVVNLTIKRGESGYILAGRFLRDSVRYAWILPNATTADITPLPVHTNWIVVKSTKDQASFATLDEYATKLAKLKGWLDLSSNTSEDIFPYHLALKSLSTGATITQGTLIENERYRLLLKADSNESYYGCRFVYMFIIQQDGTCKLFYPRQEYGSVENCFPNLGQGEHFIPTEIVLNIPPLHIIPPFGTDTYIMLATTEALSESRHSFFRRCGFTR